ncbi:MAG: hypothetical protein IKP68_04005 [Clostridia bacterium]|nr:hypothetical protein [Clostridia bacterium]
MMIDFTMGGLNLTLLIGVVLLLQGVCLFFMQNPIKRIKHFEIRDFIIFGIILVMITLGVALTVVGITTAVKLN